MAQATAPAPRSLTGQMARHVSPRAASLEQQLIIQVVEQGRADKRVTPLWFGESDLDTPAFINDATTKALAEGHTHYTYQSGIPPLRDALSTYLERLYKRAIGVARITVTTGGMNAIMMAFQTIATQGDNVVIVTPLWPNAFGVCSILGIEYKQVAMRDTEAGWTLDLERVFAACDGRTRAVYVATPGNPTGWIMPAEQQQALLDFCRKRGIWILADEVYGRMVYDRAVAPSFLALADDDDLVIVFNTFSKAWAMTGWRMGWMVAPAGLEKLLADLVQYNTSGVATFLQYGAAAAIEQGEDFVAKMVAHCRAGRDVVYERLRGLNRVHLAKPEAALYAFLRIDGMTDSLAAAKGLLVSAQVGLAPGIAFGEGGEGHLRICFANSPDLLNKALDRLVPALAKLG